MVEPRTIHAIIINSITLETEPTCNYFWGHVRDFDIVNADMTGFSTAVLEVEPLGGAPEAPMLGGVNDGVTQSLQVDRHRSAPRVGSDYWASALIRLAASTMFARAGRTSSHLRVLRPQSGIDPDLFGGKPFLRLLEEGQAAMLDQEMEISGANYLVGQFAFGDLSEEETRSSLALFHDKVVPRLAAPRDHA